MADTLVAKGSDAKFKPHSGGQFVALCVDAIDLGERVEKYQDQPEKLAHKCALVFRTGEKNPDTGDLIDVQREFTLSMHAKAGLRIFLEQWRGKAYTDDQITQGVPLHKLTGQYALLTIAQKQSGNGRTYANITACVGVPQAMRGTLPSFPAYERADYWQTRKDEYAKAARTFRAAAAAPPADDDWDQSQSSDEEDLPF
jgi:hypothetical protein